jgi:hypothetical protein
VTQSFWALVPAIALLVLWESAKYLVRRRIAQRSPVDAAEVILGG